MRIKTGFVRRRAHKKVLKLNKGYRMTKRRLYKVAKEARVHAGAYAYNGRKEKKQVFRRLWITRINGALKELGISYSQLIRKMKDKKMLLDRKILAEIASEDRETFYKIIEEIKK